jgi:ectoine hydroxylase-related dioxygenase (phytanoyl-CoA dioxygenase family)
MNRSEDLSKFHQMISSMFSWPEKPEDWEQYKISDEQIAFFHEHGYLPNVKILEDWHVDQLNEELEEIQHPEHPLNHLFYEFASNESTDQNTVLFHSLGHWRITEGFHDVLWSPAFVVAASQLLGNNSVRFWHDQLFCKPAKHGGVVAWHQDYSYWTRTQPMRHLTCWVALDDANIDNGCIHYIPGSHRWGLLDKPELAGDMEGINAYLSESQKKEFVHKVPVELPRGYATFHHPLTVHGSYENFSDRSRRAFVLNVFADGTKSNSDEPLLEGVNVIPNGAEMQGQFFPLLFER